MKIGIDISQIVYKGTGVGRYVDGLTKAILRYSRNNDWVFFFSSLRQGLDPILEKQINEHGFKLVKYRFPPTLLSLLWNDLHKINIDQIMGNLDFFVSSDWTEPPSSKIKKATIIHDLAFIRYPEIIDKKILKNQKRRLEWVKKESSLIFADSDATRIDAIDLLNIEKDKINVVYPGVEIKTIDKKVINLSHLKLHINKPFILTVGKIEPRKNLNRLIEAFQKLNNQTIDLVIVGPEGWGNFNNNKMDNIRLLGYIEDEELYALYASCLFFIYPSIWEGFGYPIIEAMRSGAPVGTSNTSSLKEISKGASLLFDPLKVEEISKTMETLINNSNLRNQLIEKGKVVSQQFTWEKAYNKIIKTLENLNNKYRR